MLDADAAEHTLGTHGTHTMAEAQEAGCATVSRGKQQVYASQLASSPVPSTQHNTTAYEYGHLLRWLRLQTAGLGPVGLDATPLTGFFPLGALSDSRRRRRGARAAAGWQKDTCHGQHREQQARSCYQLLSPVASSQQEPSDTERHGTDCGQRPSVARRECR